MARVYRDDAECQLACKLMVPGTEDDGPVNAVGCRLRQARAATTKEACVAAGPFGGDVCGDHCTVFCAMVEANCSAEPRPYKSSSDCIEACPTLPFTKEQGFGPDPKTASGDSLDCRAHHMILSLKDQGGHCPHTATVSAVCFDASDAGHDAAGH